MSILAAVPHTVSGHAVAGDGTRIAYRFDGAADLPVLVLSNSIATDRKSVV